MSKDKEFCWVGYKRENDVRNIVIEGPYSTWEQAKFERKQLKVDVDPHAVVSNPFYAASREEAIEESKKPHLWP